MYDALAQGNHIKRAMPIPVDATLQAARSLVPILLKEDAVTVHQILLGEELSAFLADLGDQTRQEDGIRNLLQRAAEASRSYHSRYVEKKGKK